MHSIYFLKNNTGRVKRPYHIQKEYSRMIHKEIPEKFSRNVIAQQIIVVIKILILMHQNLSKILFRVWKKSAARIWSSLSTDFNCYFGRVCNNDKLYYQMETESQNHENIWIISGFSLVCSIAKLKKRIFVLFVSFKIGMKLKMKFLKNEWLCVQFTNAIYVHIKNTFKLWKHGFSLQIYQLFQYEF